MVIPGYLIHECAQNMIFSRTKNSEWLGRLLSGITGCCYGYYAALQYKHFGHHVDKADVVAFDYCICLQRRPVLQLPRHVLEWFYIPALDIMMHTLQILLPSVRPAYRTKRVQVIVVLLIRGSLIALLAWYSPKALLLYVMAYFLMLDVLCFMDAFQHTYEVFETLERGRGEAAHFFECHYEYENTYSNLISLKHSWLNLLVRNLSYHNAQHFKQAVPWHWLPALHRERYWGDDSQLIAFHHQWWSYHAHRVARIKNNFDKRSIVGVEKNVVLSVFTV